MLNHNTTINIDVVYCMARTKQNDAMTTNNNVGQFILYSVKCCYDDVVMIP